jgi:hypothetical protein
MQGQKQTTTASQRSWDGMYRRNCARLKAAGQARPHHDTGPVTAAEAQQRLYRLMARTVAREEGSLGIEEARPMARTR